MTCRQRILCIYSKPARIIPEIIYPLFTAYFTIFFNATGVASGISIKNASLVSGTMSAEGIKNLIWAFVMTEKGDDPENKLMKVGAFRVIKDNDGLAENTAWPSATRAFEPVFDFSENSKGIQN